LAQTVTDFVLAYDAGCGPCSGFRALVHFLDARRLIRFVPLDAADESGLLAGIAPASRYASFHLIRPPSSAGGVEKRWSGSEAILPLIRSLSPWGRAVSRAIEAVPKGEEATSFAYSTLSRLHRGCTLQQDGDPRREALH
jgi:predicted DCC family thiol-disulfide oxidoreductase YuxK